MALFVHVRHGLGTAQTIYLISRYSRGMAMGDQKTIPIFPLDLVLFPRQELPLRVFEPRYKQLVDDCMLGDGQFGVCLVDPRGSVDGWEAPYMVGTMAKITKCEDVGLDGMQLQVDTMGRNTFRIVDIIPPAVPRPEGYDPHSVAGHSEVSRLHEKAGTGKKMYVQAKVEMLPEIDEDVPLERWDELVVLWKEMIVKRALPQVVESHSLDHVLEQYYLATETPTIDYVYSLAALGAREPGDLQPLLEARTMDGLLSGAVGLLGAK